MLVRVRDARNGREAGAPVERDPLYFLEKDEPRGDEELSEGFDGDAVLLMPLEVDAGLGEELNRLGGVHVVAAKREGSKVSRLFELTREMFP